MDYQIGNFIEPVIMALPPLVLPAIAAGMGLIDPISKFFTARKQKKMARNLKKSTYVPESLNTAISEGRQGAYSARGLDQGVDEALLRKQQAGQQYMGKQAGGSSAQKLAMAAQVGGNFSDRLRQITAQGRRGQHGRRQNYQNLLLGKANVQMENQRVFEGAKSALIGASMQNRHNAWSGVGGAVGNVLGTIAKYKGGAIPPLPTGQGGENTTGANIEGGYDTSGKPDYMGDILFPKGNTGVEPGVNNAIYRRRKTKQGAYGTN